MAKAKTATPRRTTKTQASSSAPPDPALSAAGADSLHTLLEAERQSIFRLMSADSPYLREASDELKAKLSAVAAGGVRRAEELLERLQAGGASAPHSAAAPAEQGMLKYLSLKFLLPKLADEKQLFITRYESILAREEDLPRDVVKLLKEQLAEHREDLKTLRQAAGKTIAAAGGKAPSEKK